MLDKLMTPETKKLMQAFDKAGFEVRFVGGCVRDVILNVTPKDIDFATDATPDEMKDIATINKFKFLPTGVEHGTATLVVDGEPFEVTTLRVDVETDGRHAEVEFTRSFEVDAERRDLTINAMSMDMKGEVYDYFNGREDLQNKVVRFVGDARKRVEEDYLRILRYFRFAARFDATMEQEVLDVFAEAEVLDKLNLVSVERFWLEMNKILDPKMPARTRIVDAMMKSRVNRALGLFRFDPATLTRSNDSLTALSTMVQKDDLDKFTSFWKLSSSEESKVRWMVTNRDMVLTFNNIEEMLVIKSVPRDYLVSLAEMQGETVLADHARNFVVPAFPVNGQDLIASGMKPGPEMGARLARMKKAWMYSNWAASKETLMEVE